MLFFVYQSSSIHIKDSIKLRVNYAEFVVDIIAALNTCIVFLLYFGGPRVNTCIVLTRSSQHCPCIGSQMSSNCGKNKEVAHELQASVSLMFYHVLTSSVIYYRPGSWQNGIYQYCTVKREEEAIYIYIYIYIYIPASYHVTVR